MPDLPTTLDEWLRTAPCGHPDFVFKPYVQWCETGNCWFVYLKDVPVVARDIGCWSGGPHMTIYESTEDGSVAGFMIVEESHA